MKKRKNWNKKKTNNNKRKKRNQNGTICLLLFMLRMSTYQKISYLHFLKQQIQLIDELRRLLCTWSYWVIAQSNQFQLPAHYDQNEQVFNWVAMKWGEPWNNKRSISSISSSISDNQKKRVTFVQINFKYTNTA